MTRTLTDILIEQSQEKEKYFRNYFIYAKEIKKEAKKIVPKVEVFLFGSVLKKGEPPRDIDVLLISPAFKEYPVRNKTGVLLWQKIGFASPFEFHFITPRQYRNWYRFFIPQKQQLKV